MDGVLLSAKSPPNPQRAGLSPRRNGGTEDDPHGKTLLTVSVASHAAPPNGAGMTPDRFRKCLTALHWSQRGLADTLGVQERQVRRWPQTTTLTYPVKPGVFAPELESACYIEFTGVIYH